MAEINSPIVKIENEKFQIAVDLNLYSKEVITATSYKFSHLYYIHQQIDENNTTIVNVIFESKDQNIITIEAPKLFCNELIDQQIRYNTNLQFGQIRDMIVEEAFKPINKK